MLRSDRTLFLHQDVYTFLSRRLHSTWAGLSLLFKTQADRVWLDIVDVGRRHNNEML